MKNRLLIVSFNSLSRTQVLLREESGSLEECEIPVEIGKKEVGDFLDRLIVSVDSVEG